MMQLHLTKREAVDLAMSEMVLYPTSSDSRLQTRVYSCVFLPGYVFGEAAA
jgi:hypothetical protein